MSWSRQKNLLEEMMVKVLQDSKEPMTLNDIVDSIRKNNPGAFRGKTPKNSLYSIIYKHEKRRKERNEEMLFNIDIKQNYSLYSLRKPS